MPSHEGDPVNAIDNLTAALPASHDGPIGVDSRDLRAVLAMLKVATLPVGDPPEHIGFAYWPMDEDAG